MQSHQNQLRRNDQCHWRRLLPHVLPCQDRCRTKWARIQMIIGTIGMFRQDKCGLDKPGAVQPSHELKGPAGATKVRSTMRPSKLVSSSTPFSAAAPFTSRRHDPRTEFDVRRKFASLAAIICPTDIPERLRMQTHNNLTLFHERVRGTYCGVDLPTFDIGTTCRLQLRTANDTAMVETMARTRKSHELAPTNTTTRA